MYSWYDDTSDWARPAAYSYSPTTKAERDAEAARAAAAGPRAYTDKRSPDEQLVDPKKRIVSHSKDPLIIAVDVTGSMQRWPFEIFDRLPLLFNTLSQYKPHVEISFAAIGDAVADRWPLQTTDFARGFDLEKLLKAIYGEGGGGDAPESYGLFAHWVDTHVAVPNANRPFLIVFGDAPMHPTVPAGQIAGILGDTNHQDVDSIQAWNRVSEKWNTWFLRRPGGRAGDETDLQWGHAIGAQQVIQIDDEQRAVDYAMGLVARTWGHFGDFKENMLARQDEKRVAELEKRLDDVKPRVLVCPACGASIPPEAHGRFTCGYCRSTVSL
jgi:hypothetical protein